MKLLACIAWLIDCLLSWRLISCCLEVIGSRGSIEGIFLHTIPGFPMCVFVLRRGWSWSCWITRKDGKLMKRCGLGFSSPDGSLNCLICWEESNTETRDVFFLGWAHFLCFLLKISWLGTVFPSLIMLSGLTRPQSQYGSISVQSKSVKWSAKKWRKVYAGRAWNCEFIHYDPNCSEGVLADTWNSKMSSHVQTEPW